jgi:hypothetical protein
MSTGRSWGSIAPRLSTISNRDTASRARRPANGRAIPAGSRGARSTCCDSRHGAHDAADRRPPLHLAQHGDHHIQQIYSKINVSTRAAAALRAMQHTVVQ